MPTAAQEDDDGVAAYAENPLQLLKDELPPPPSAQSTDDAADSNGDVGVDGDDGDNVAVVAADAAAAAIADAAAIDGTIPEASVATPSKKLQQEAAAAVAYANDQLLKDPTLLLPSLPAMAVPPGEDEASGRKMRALSKPNAASFGEALKTASKIKDKATRDRTLMPILVNCRGELDDAEAAHRRAVEHLAATKEIYDACAHLLSGYTPLETRLEANNKDKKRRAGDASLLAKRARRQSSGDDLQSAEEALPSTTMQQQPQSNPPRIKGQVQLEGHNIILPANEIYLPEYYAAGGGMTEDIVSSFRDNFYRTLTRGRADASTIDQWTPPHGNANLKSKAQLAEWIHIAMHWNTGADGMDAGAFRAKHKTWYSRMKPVTYNLGRRTGIHLRQLDGIAEGYGDDGGEGTCTTVLCRYNKAGNKSTVYLDVGRLFDALFQIHALELNHRGRDATKNLADERYANVPDGTVRAFLDTCPVCNARRGHGSVTLPMDLTAHRQEL
eukprot:CAMPEP_0183735838 /NCGR_PEP_ID=MMETSP0737-20130205/47730_1 /TAXON_ID=385413 /ORGANISM="Thalassiosira miniscula, Strain CCMP1093" /LENGTH=498 /DNA_ID=CAMNT_0025969689 /DNA_START=45 /DNA_END=1541 /DNA_ORIENTATION=+